MKTIYDNPRQALLAYLAGIIDGEGTISIHKVKIKKNWNYSYAVRINVGMTNYEVIKLFADTFGLNIRQERPRGVHRQFMYRCGTSGNKNAIRIIKQLFPYLIVKRKNAEVAFEFAKGFNSRKHSKKRKCVNCGEIKSIQGRGLCHKCYIRMYRAKKLKQYTNNLVFNDRISSDELQRREELYREMKKLNAVGAAAETKQEQTREG